MISWDKFSLKTINYRLNRIVVLGLKSKVQIHDTDKDKWFKEPHGSYAKDMLFNHYFRISQM